MRSIKKSIICKNVNDFSVDKNIVNLYKPKAGDVGIFEVVELGSLKAIQHATGRNCYIFPGDLIMVTFGNRYASNQFEGYVPDSYHQEYDLIGKGGVAGIVKSMFHKLEILGPTKLRLIGYATDLKGEVINTIYYHTAQKRFQTSKSRSFKTILSLGSSMDSGKTTTAAFLCRALKEAGNRVAFIKLTGTVFNKDRMLAYDCGADVATDFSEVGFPSTYLCSMDCLMDLYEGLIARITASRPDYVVMEIADGLYQRETNLLLNNPVFRKTIDHVILSCGDSLAVSTGTQILSGLFSHRLFALAGLFTASPLMIQEVESKCSIPVLTLEKMGQENVLADLLAPRYGIAV